MAYCTISEVQAQLPHLTLSTTTKPTLAEVTQWVTDVGDGEMLARLRGVLDTSLIDATGTAYLKNLNIYAVVARVYTALRNQPEIADTYKEMYEDGMSAVVSNPAIVITLSSDRGAQTSTAPTVIFKRNTDQW